MKSQLEQLRHKMLEAAQMHKQAEQAIKEERAQSNAHLDKLTRERDELGHRQKQDEGKQKAEKAPQKLTNLEQKLDQQESAAHELKQVRTRLAETEREKELLMKSTKKQSEMNAGKVDAVKVKEVESRLADAQREKELLTYADEGAPAKREGI